ncbi:MAG TPA: tetratricopeptide repeat protein [Vicinamibacterales bacterium]|nr:tetratricopeptide repeat protein [Vicinamibacterales bacterium]
MIMRNVAAGAVGVCLALALAACGSNPATVRDQHLKRGDQFVAEHKMPEAAIEFKAAVQADPRSVDARSKLARVLMQQGDGTGALEQYVRASDLAPEDATLQLQAGTMLLLGGRYEDARTRAEKVLAGDPRSVPAQILRANALGGLKSFDDAIRQIERVISSDPSAGVGYSSLGALQVAKGDPMKAEDAFKKAVAANPKSIDVRLGLANFYWSTGRVQEAEKEITETLSIDPNNLVANRALALLYLGSGRTAAAEAPLKVVAEHATESSGRLALADYYAFNQRATDARPIYEQLAKDTDAQTAATAKLRLVSLDSSLNGDRAAAYRLVEEVLTKQPNYSPALVAKAQLQLGDGKTDDALKNAKAAVTASPDSAQAQFLYGRILAVGGGLDEAIAAQKDALKANARFAPAAIELARLSLLTSRPADAVQFARTAVQIWPGSPDAALMLARAEMAAGNPTGAEAPLKMLMAGYADSPTTQAEVGRLYLLRGNQAAARTAFEKSLAKDPQQLSALEGLTVLDIGQKKTPAARARLDAALKAAPKNAPLQVLAGRLYAQMGDLSMAETVLKQALATDPNNTGAYDLLARVYVEQKKLPEATAEFQQAANRQPKAVGPQTAIAVLLSLQGKTDEARAQYEKVIALDPNAAVAANNLAQMYADRNENLDVALQLAETAKRQMPDNPDVDDTIGWVYYKKRVSALAVAAFKRSVAAQPQNALYLSHLGMAYAQAGSRALARQTLEKALKISTTFDGADEARRLLQSLGG